MQKRNKKGKPTDTQAMKQTKAKQSSGGYTVPINRTYKARLFEMIFSESTELLQLYNAMNETDYKDPQLLEINTLQNAIYMSMRNDLSFIIDSRLTLYEHQSTYSPNLPLRCLMYTADLYSVITKEQNLYGTKQVRIPTPRFVIFYNGKEAHGDKTLLKLSDAFTVEEEEYSLELTAVMLNINKGHNNRLMESCKTLRDYSQYVAKVREYAETMSLKVAVEQAITECINNDILADFLRNNRAEAKSMSIYEYDEEKHIRQVKEEGRQEGNLEGSKNKLLEQVKKKLKKGKTLPVIADELEESENVIQSLIEEIKESQRPCRIFERFYKADPSRRKGYSGLGLAIVNELVRQTGGNLIFYTYVIIVLK